MFVFGEFSFFFVGSGNAVTKSLLDSGGDPLSAFNATIAMIRG